jgi:3-hydroxyacyl-[acyl-carrier-protein] dehydratase
MRLTLIDRILDVQPGTQITAIKNVSLSEDYLADHFPRFPIMPGVLMLEAMYQTAAWLVRATDGFAHSLVLLSEANNVKYSDFVEPGQTLRVTAELVKCEQRTYKLKCQGEKCQAGSEPTVAVRGRLVLEVSNLAETQAGPAATDAMVLDALRKKYELLYPPALGGRARKVVTENS